MIVRNSKAAYLEFTMEARKKIGLALGGGAVRGFAHLGVIQVLQREGIPIDYVAGTSVGSLIGAAYCSGMPLDEILEISKKVNWRNIVGLHWGNKGIVTFRGIRTLIDEIFDEPTFGELKTPFAVVTTDIDADRGVVISEGRVAPAVEASCSVSGLVAPVDINGKRLADGIFVNAVPVSVVQEMGAEYVIGVDVFKPLIRPYGGFISYLFNALEIVLRHAGGGLESADCLISPDIEGFTYMRFGKRKELIELGRQAAESKLPEIQQAIS
jgi:NTE family protein